ncbi:hypothetical protein THIOM_002266 [Candidatus Thiomargarita nelsonii]|uniref:Uncharacterized protein n=1 Tax=Candidatus Thiomargarita nelsonii TaxID=1003181 RepID=A0A176S1X8_9GAMM|nr:hypothetical protein THIOM_002266 [Candidatus Thiomargarita nelsonii]
MRDFWQRSMIRLYSSEALEYSRFLFVVQHSMYSQQLISKRRVRPTHQTLVQLIKK